MPTHIYRPLRDEDIRILQICPGTKDEPLFGSLELGSLGTSTYEAISYAWGDPVFNRSIWIGSEELRITDSMFGALRRFRDTQRDVYLWADQLCINQSDLVEKNAQVAIMAKIFGYAHKVYVWLGEAEQQHDIACAMMDFLGGPWWSTMVQKSNRDPYFIEVSQGWNDQYPHATLEEGLAAFSTIVKKAWFERLWVVQEVLAARHYNVLFYCGEYSFLLSKAVAAFRRFDAVTKMNVLPKFDADRELQVASLYDPTFFREDTTRAGPFLKVLFETSHLKATEPRDRVFALMAIGKIREGDEIKVNYAIEVPDLWRLVAKFLLKTAIGDLRPLVLALPATQRGTAEVSSSWSTDFSALTPESQRKRTWYSKEPVYMPRAGNYPISISNSLLGVEETNVWKWRGVVVDKVDRVLADSSLPVLPSTPDQGLLELAMQLFHRHSACLKFTRQIAPALSRYDFNYLLRQGTRQPNRYRYRQALGQAFKQALEDKLLSVSSEENIDSVLNDLCDLPLTEGLSYMDHSRLLASTDGGYPGWIPYQAKVGDHVCLLEGFPAPFIARELDGLDDLHYAIVGDAYIRGMMEGELWPKNLNSIATLKFK